jgi:transcriptional regulator with XRE-family HTH domain
MNYGKALKTIRAAKNMTQGDLAHLTGLDASYISRIEKGNRTPTLESLENIANKLSIPIYLLTLLASEQSDLNKIDIKNKNEVASELLDLLISAQTTA